MYSQSQIDPLISFKNTVGESVRGTIVKLQRKSLVMEVYNPYSIVQISEVLSELTIRIGNKVAYLGKAVVISLVNTGLTALVSVTLIDEWQDLYDVVITPGAVSIHDNAQYCLSMLLSFVNSIHSINPQINCHSETTAHQMVLSLLDTYPLTVEQHAAIKIDIQNDFKVTALPNCVALVLSSILSNALRALKGHLSPQVTISILINKSPQIRISNNGPCIPPDILARLMDAPFTTHAESGGKGWGMVFCRRVMHSFGGNILISSTPESGTAITLKFPLTKARLRSSELT